MSEILVTPEIGKALEDAVEFVKAGIFFYAVECMRNQEDPQLEGIRRIGREAMQGLLSAVVGPGVPVDEHIRVTATISDEVVNGSHPVALDFKGLTVEGIAVVRLYVLGDTQQGDEVLQ